MSSCISANWSTNPKRDPTSPWGMPTGERCREYTGHTHFESHSSLLSWVFLGHHVPPALTLSSEVPMVTFQFEINFIVAENLQYRGRYKKNPSEYIIYTYACAHVMFNTHMCMHILLHVLKHACSCLSTFTCPHNFIVNYLIVAGFVYYCVFSIGNLEVNHRLVSSHDCVPVCSAWYVWIKSSMELVLHKVLLLWIWIWNISITCLFYDIDYFRQRPDFFFMNIFLWWTQRFNSFHWWYFFSKHIYKYMNGDVILEGLVELGFCFL